jgi:hypothetical protein
LKRELSSSNPPRRVDENVQFTVYRPKAIAPECWYPLIAFAHLTSKRADASPHEPDPIKEVKLQATALLGERLVTEYRPVTQDASQAVPREETLTFVPHIPGIEFNPPSRSFRWSEPVHREEFLLRAGAELVGQTARGRLSVFLGDILLADVSLAIPIDASALPPTANAPSKVDSAGSYRKIFASYSHKDLHVVEQLEQLARALGDEYLRDWKHLRAGEVWDERLRQMIEEADVFQLFWSHHAMESAYVRQEWEHALSLNRPYFVRPTYWEEPLPGDPARDLPPAELRRLHFQRIGPHERLLPRIVPDPAGCSTSARPLPGSYKTARVRSLRVALLYKRHVRTDEALLKWLEEAFATRGYQVFVDRNLGIGVEWAKELDRRIRESDAVIPLISAASVQSEMLTSELQIAHEEGLKCHGKPRILPVRVNFEGKLPAEMGGVLNRLQYFLWKNPQDNPRLLAELIGALEKPPAGRAGGAPPTGVLPTDSRCYIERSVDQEMQEAISRQDSVIRIHGARQVGKTSLLARALEQARAPGTRVVVTNFQQLNTSDLRSVDTLFRTLGEWIADKLQLDIDIDQFWSSHRNPSLRFNNFICQEVLGRIDGRLVWGMDEVDRLFPCPFRSEVFGLFRSWHNARLTEPTQPWRRLTVVMVYATEAHLLIENLDQSPFNFGTSIVLDDFTTDQLAELNRRYDFPLQTVSELEAYWNLVGGHPYLANRGLHEMVQKGLDMAAFKQQAERDDGVFNDHLRRLPILLSKDAGLCEVVRSVLRGQGRASNDNFLRLRSAGVLAGESIDDMRMRCELYASYLKRHLL